MLTCWSIFMIHERNTPICVILNAISEAYQNPSWPRRFQACLWRVFSSFSRLILGPSLPVNPFFSQPNSVLNSISWKTLLVPKLSYPNGIWRHLKEHHLFHLTKGANHVIRSHPLHLSFLSRGFGNLGNLNRSNGSYRPPQTSLKCSLPFSRVI